MNENIVTTIINNIGKVAVAIFAAAGLYTVANEIRKDHQEQMDKIQPMIEECTNTMKTMNKSFDLYMKKELAD